MTRFAKRYREMEQRIAGIGTVRASRFSSFAPGSEASAVVRSDIGTHDANVDVNRGYNMRQVLAIDVPGSAPGVDTLR